MNTIKNLKGSQKGFTLIEILVVIGMIAILATIVLIAINPARQFAQTRNSQRVSNVNTILNAYGQRVADNKGLFQSSTDPVCLAAMDIPSTAVSEATAAKICFTLAGCTGTTVNMRPCLVPTYMSELPVDPKSGTACVDSTCTAGYDTAYTIWKDATTGRVTVFAPTASTVSELNQDIRVTR